MNQEIEKLSTEFFLKLQEIYEKNNQSINQIIIVSDNNELSKGIEEKITELKEVKENVAFEDDRKKCRYFPGIGVICIG